MGFLEWAQLILSLASTIANSVGKPVEEITYEDLKNFRSFDEIFPPQAKKEG